MGSRFLKISHFPDNFNTCEIEDFLKHFGASQVKCVGKKRQIAFATFDEEKIAATALKRLHQLEVMSCRLVAVFAKKKPDEWTDVSAKNDAESNMGSEADSHKCYEKFLQSLNAWSLPMDLNQPPPSHLQYLYPPPSLEVVANIARALVAVPKFYTQVLHLMNKMNIPSPFHRSSPEYQTAIMSMLGFQVSLAREEPASTENGAAVPVEEAMPHSTSESEMESDSEPASVIPDYIPTKRKSGEKRLGIKRPKLIKLQRSDPGNAKPGIAVADVFDVGSIGPQKNITMKLGAREDVQKESVQSQDTSDQTGFGILFPSVPPNTEAEQQRVEEKEEDGSYILLTKLQSNRISERDQGSLPVYRNYQAGAPSCRLYIKNLAKTTTARDLHFIFRAFLGHKPTDEEDNKMFDVLHMTEGRMKGQAFVTFPSVAQAQKAVKEVNGYILNDKPMVVAFGRSKVQTVTSAS